MERSPRSALRGAALGVGQSRLAHFVVLGGALFALARWRGDERRIHLDRRDGRGGAADAEAEARAVEDLVLVREARRLGLERGDDIVQRRLVQKMLLLAEDLGGANVVPDDFELRRFFEAHADRYAQPAAVRFVHVYATTRERADALRDRVSGLAPPGEDGEPPALGDPLPVSRRVDGTLAEVSAAFGPQFAATVFSQAAEGASGFHGPFPSKLGFHYVAVVRVSRPRPLRYDEVAREVARDATAAKREEAVHRFVRAAEARYEIDVDGHAPASLEGAPRTAAHVLGSAED